MATITFHLFYTNCEECEGCVALQTQKEEGERIKVQVECKSCKSTIIYNIGYSFCIL